MDGVILALGISLVFAALVRGPFARQLVSERWLLSAIGTLLALALVSLVLARIELYSTPNVALALLGFACSLFLAFRQRESLPGPPAPFADHWSFALVPLPFVVLYALYPTYFLLGGQDPGVYLVFAARIAQSGGLDLDLPFLRELWKGHPGGIALGYPGIYSLIHSDVGTDPSRLSPQFMHLFPALAANAWAAFGLEGVVRANAVVAGLTLWTGFAFVRRLIGVVPAVLFVLALGLNPAFVWGARITLTEVLAALLNLSGLFLLLLASESERREWALLAGAVLGLGILNRLDAGFAAIPVLGFALATAARPALIPAAQAAAFGYLTTATVGFIDGSSSAPFYFETLRGKHHLDALIAISMGSAILAAWIPTWFKHERVRLFVFESLLPRGSGELLRVLVAWVVLVAVLWPKVAATADARAGLELGWYLTPIACPLFLLGFAMAARSRAWSRFLPLLLFAAATLLAYTIERGVAPEHLWASRRWVPSVIPLALVVCLVGAVHCVRWSRRVRALAPVVMVVLGASYFLPVLDFARSFLFRGFLDGLPGAYADFAARVRAAAVPTPLLTGSHHVASILTYLYDVPTVMFGNRTQYGLEAPEARKALARGDFGGFSCVGLDALDGRHSVEESTRFVGELLESTRDRKPRAITRYEVSFELGRIGGRTFELETPPTHARFASPVGKVDGAAIATTGRPGTLLHGPYLDLESGQYEVDWIGRVVSAAPPGRQGVIDVIADRGRVVLASMPLQLRANAANDVWLGGLDFHVEQPTPGVEFRLRTEADNVLRLTAVRFRRVQEPPPEPPIRQR